MNLTITFPVSAYVWNSVSAISAVTMPAYRIAVGREDGSKLINSLVVYNQRKVNSTYYLVNMSEIATYYQFLDKDNVALEAKVGLVVAATTYLATITVPANAYTVEFTGALINSGTNARTNILQIKTVDTASGTSNWDFTQQLLAYEPYSRFNIIINGNFNSNARHQCRT